MKKCMCCGTEAGANAETCANCGEASWSTATVGEAKDEPIGDPETSLDTPRVRRGGRKPS